MSRNFLMRTFAVRRNVGRFILGFPPRRRPRSCVIVLANLLLLVFTTCRNVEREEVGPVFTVMTYNLARYNLNDRDGDGQFNDPKPENERRAVWTVIAAESPDILAVQEIGNPTIFEEFRYGLKNAGLDYPHVAYLRRGQSELNMAVLSRFPIEQTWEHLDDRYGMGEAELPVLRGFLECEIAVTTNYRMRLIVAHLKSKVFHQLGQTEMRRNEARLLNKLVRARLKENPAMNLLVVGDMNDNYNSAALREIMGSSGEYLRDVRPEDSAGDVWTRYDPADDSYSRIDYILASPGIYAEYVSERSHVVRHPLTYVASDHRPLLASFYASDRPESQKAGEREPNVARMTTGSVGTLTD